MAPDDLGGGAGVHHRGSGLNGARAARVERTRRAGGRGRSRRGGDQRPREVRLHNLGGDGALRRCDLREALDRRARGSLALHSRQDRARASRAPYNGSTGRGRARLEGMAPAAELHAEPPLQAPPRQWRPQSSERSTAARPSPCTRCSSCAEGSESESRPRPSLSARCRRAAARSAGWSMSAPASSLAAWLECPQSPTTVRWRATRTSPSWSTPTAPTRARWGGGTSPARFTSTSTGASEQRRPPASLCTGRPQVERSFLRSSPRLCVAQAEPRHKLDRSGSGAYPHAIPKLTELHQSARKTRQPLSH